MVLGDVAEPQLIWTTSGEVALDKIIVHRRANLAVLTAFLAEHAPQSILRADPPGGALGHRFAGLAGLFGWVDIE